MIMFTEDYIDYLEKVVYKDRPELVSALKLHNKLLNELCFILLDKETNKDIILRLAEELETNAKNIRRLIRKL